MSVPMATRHMRCYIRDRMTDTEPLHGQESTASASRTRDKSSRHAEDELLSIRQGKGGFSHDGASGTFLKSPSYCCIND